MKKSIALAIAAIGIGLTTNVFANTAGTQVNPSTINLSAAGVTEVGIHTQIANAECTSVGGLFVVSVEVTNDGLPGEDSVSGFYVFNPDDLSVGVDSLGHLVITIVAWDEITSHLDTGEAGFFVQAECTVDDGEGGTEVAFISNGDDTAKIVDNSGVNNR